MKSAIAFAIFLCLVLVVCQSCGSGSGNDGKWKTISSSPNMNTAIPANDQDTKKGGFTANLPEGFVLPTDDVGRKLFKDYGSVFVAKGGVTPPNTVVFKDEADVSKFQSGAASSRETISGVSIELQTAAMQALKDAVAEAKQGGASKLVDLKSSLTMDMETQLLQLPQLAIQLTLKDPKLAQTDIAIPIEGDGAETLMKLLVWRANIKRLTDF